MTLKLILIRKVGVHACMSYYVHLVLENTWLLRDIGDSVLFLTLVKQRLKDQFIQNWNGRLVQSNRAIFYKHTSSFGFKHYINILTISKFRYSMG
mgnify:CR=1 FL=1